MLPNRPALALTLAVAVFALPRAALAGASVGVGVDDLTSPGVATVKLDVTGDRALLPVLSLGARVGLLLGSADLGAAVPIDARLRLHLESLYIDGLVGPWIFLHDNDTVRLHSAIGLGITRRALQVGVEAGWVNPSTIVGLRVAFSI